MISLVSTCITKILDICCSVQLIKFRILIRENELQNYLSYGWLPFMSVITYKGSQMTDNSKFHFLLSTFLNMKIVTVASYIAETELVHLNFENNIMCPV